MNQAKELNKAQSEAVESKGGPIMVVAGAGTGKTRVITHRILHLLNNGVPPEAIVAITFTNKAATEMRERVSSELSKQTGQIVPFIGTFHSLGVKILRENAEVLGIRKRFAIFDRGDSKKVIGNAIRELGFSTKTHDPAKILGIISSKKGNNVTLDLFTEESGNQFMRDVAQIWRLYEKKLANDGALDFDDLLLLPARLLSENERIRKHYQNTIDHVLVDEYQDTNAVQYALIRHLAGTKQNVFVVGDIDQNIYTWRGARISHLLNFTNDFPSAEVFMMTENYRSTQTVLSAANQVISKNTVRHEKTLESRGEEGEKISLMVSSDGKTEARTIATLCESLLQNGVPAEEIAVLYRANFQSRALEEAFLGARIPYQVVGTRFFERKEVKDMLAYIEAALNQNGETHMVRIINTPPRGIGKITVLKLFSGREHELSRAMGEKVASFKHLLSSIKKCSETHKPSELLRYILKESDMESYLKASGDDGYERLENIFELIALAERYDALLIPDGLDRFLESVRLAEDQDRLIGKVEGVRLMTVHAAKGLEFEHVFIAGLEEGLFPHERIQYVQTIEEQEEERRLCYVALTRAKKKLYLSYAMERTIFGSTRSNVPSTFLLDIDESLYETEPSLPSISLL